MRPWRARRPNSGAAPEPARRARTCAGLGPTLAPVLDLRVVPPDHPDVRLLVRGVQAEYVQTGARQPEAIALYTSAGYAPTQTFGVYRDAPGCRCFAKPLIAVARGA